MTKQHFLALADSIRRANSIVSPDTGETVEHFTRHAISELADFCAAQNPAFDRERWLAYVAGDCGPNGGTVKRKRA